jgi:hypothetical protein
MSADGSTVIVGANSYQSGLGAAYVFGRSGDTWSREARLTGKPHTASANFGNAVALDADGSTALVGAVYQGAGAAYVYDHKTAGWHQASELTVSGTSQFGSAVGLDAAGDTAVVGAEAAQTSGTAYVFGGSGGSWTQQDVLTPTVTDQALFGIAVSLDAAGDLAIVGAAFDDDGVPGQSGYGAIYLEPLP